MDAWRKSPVDVLITDEISHWGLSIVSFDGDWYDTIVSIWFFKGDFTNAILCCCSQFLA